jgi:YHS domain-containing protein
MESLLYFAFWAAVIFLMMRFGCGAHIMGHGHGRENKDPGQSGSQRLRWVPPKEDTDPVCQQVIRTENAKPSVYAGSVYYFCSRECREVFEAAPHLYATDGGQSGPGKLEHFHA